MINYQHYYTQTDTLTWIQTHQPMPQAQAHIFLTASFVGTPTVESLASLARHVSLVPSIILIHGHRDRAASHVTTAPKVYLSNALSFRGISIKNNPLSW